MPRDLPQNTAASDVVHTQTLTVFTESPKSCRDHSSTIPTKQARGGEETKLLKDNEILKSSQLTKSVQRQGGLHIFKKLT